MGQVMAGYDKDTGVVLWSRQNLNYNPDPDNRTYGGATGLWMEDGNYVCTGGSGLASWPADWIFVDPDTGALLWSSDWYFLNKETDNRGLTALYNRPDEGEIFFGLGAWGGNGGDWTGDGRVRAMRRSVPWDVPPGHPD
jgi:hypothetical protein